VFILRFSEVVSAEKNAFVNALQLGFYESFPTCSQENRDTNMDGNAERVASKICSYESFIGVIYHLKALVFLYAFEESVGCHLLSSFCDDSNLHIPLFKYALSTMGVSKELISKFLIGNRFHVKLHILSPYSNLFESI